MLESIRNSAQSFGVKVAFGVIILVFVFWGVGNFNDRDYSNVVAMVNGQPIVAMEFEKAYLNAEEYLLRNNPGMTREQLAKDHLGRQVLNELVQQTLLMQEAQRAGITVSPVEMRSAVEGIQAFHNEQGKFDPEVYKRVLAARRMSVGDYEKDLANQLLRDKMFALLTAGAWVDPDEARHRFDFLRERRDIDYIFVPASKFADKVKITDAEVNSWYEEHKNEYAIPATVDVEYISVAPADLVDRAKISEDAARAWYEANKSRYERPEQIHARHILVSLPQDADEAAVKAAEEKLAKAKAEIAAGKTFAEVAEAINPQGAADKGGDLGWLKRGETVPEFESVAFELTPGQISEPLRTPFGLHIVQVDEKKAAGVAPFEEVSEEAYKGVAADEGADKLHDVLDNLIEDNILMKPLLEAAQKYGLTTAKTGLLSKNDLGAKLGIKQDAIDALIATPAGSPLDTALEAGDKYLVARVIDAKPSGIKPLADVRKSIEEAIAREQTLQFAMQDAEKLLQRIKGESLQKIRADKLPLETPEAVERAGSVAGFLPNDALMRAIFASPLHSWLSKPVGVVKADGPAGALIVYVDKQIRPNDEEFAGVAEILGNAAKQQRMEGVFGLLMENLAKKAKIQITNQNIIDRVGA